MVDRHKQKPPKHPNRIFIPGAGWHRLSVLMINTKDQGRPKLCTFLHEEQTIHLAGGEEFVTAYVPEAMLKKR